MNLQYPHDRPSALCLQDNCIHLARNGTLRSHAKNAEIFRNPSKYPELMEGRLLVLHHVSGPQDVHYPIWEMHPAGDELLILSSGSLAVEFRSTDMQRVPLTLQTALIVPAGIWHRLIVHEPSVLIAITPRQNTVHEKD